MNRWTAEVLLHYELGWWGYDYWDDPIEMETWEDLVNGFMEEYKNKNEAYKAGVPRPPAEFWEAHKRK